MSKVPYESLLDFIGARVPYELRLGSTGAPPRDSGAPPEAPPGFEEVSPEARLGALEEGLTEASQTELTRDLQRRPKRS